MSPVTRGWDADWNDILGPNSRASHRSTTSSRRPGKAIEGAVNYRPSAFVTCPACGGLRRQSASPHAPHFLSGRLVDCAGRSLSSEVSRCC